MQLFANAQFNVSTGTWEDGFKPPFIREVADDHTLALDQPFTIILPAFAVQTHTRVFFEVRTEDYQASTYIRLQDVPDNKEVRQKIDVQDIARPFMIGDVVRVYSYLWISTPPDQYWVRGPVSRTYTLRDEGAGRLKS